MAELTGTTPRHFDIQSFEHSSWIRHWNFVIRHFLAILLLPSLGAADAARDLSPTLAPLVQRYHLPGMVGAILHGDKLVALGSTGIRKIGDPALFLSTDQIHLGSDTKAMTAVLIGRLIDQKQLSFDSPMADLFPDLAGRMNHEMSHVTVRNLLDHTAGFPHDLDWWALDRSNLPLPGQRRMVVEKALSVPPKTPIGKFSYSNISYVLLGAIIESKTGKPWEEVIAHDIFQPLHMDTAGFGPPGAKGEVGEPWGHVLLDGQLMPMQSDNAAVIGPAGRVHCSITDWSKFIAETLGSARGHPTLMSAGTFRQLTTPMPGLGYAGGWIVTTRDWAGGTALTHSGSNTMWFCTVWIAPAKNFAVLLATNDGSEPVAKAVDEGIGLLVKFNQDLQP